MVPLKVLPPGSGGDLSPSAGFGPESLRVHAFSCNLELTEHAREHQKHHIIN